MAPARDPNADLVTLATARKILGGEVEISRSAFYALVRAHAFPILRPTPGTRRVRRRDLQDYLDGVVEWGVLGEEGEEESRASARRRTRARTESASARPSGASGSGAAASSSSSLSAEIARELKKTPAITWQSLTARPRLRLLDAEEMPRPSPARKARDR